MRSGRKKKKISALTVIGVLLILAACLLLGGRIRQGAQASKQAEQVIGAMDQMIPQYGEDDAAGTGIGEDPLPMIEIGGISFVGYLEIPAPGEEAVQRLPVACAEYDGELFAFQDSGSPVSGGFVIGGRDLKGVFGSIGKIEPGQTVSFTDVNGIRYTYTVTGLGKTRELEAEHHDLILYRGIGRHSKYAVYGSAE